MRYLVDTDWVADYPGGKRPAIDPLIAATQERSLIPVTRNTKDFARIPDLMSC
jgi:predicted nucleic acid-binding protein